MKNLLLVLRWNIDGLTKNFGGSVSSGRGSMLGVVVAAVLAVVAFVVVPVVAVALQGVDVFSWKEVLLILTST